MTQSASLIKRFRSLLSLRLSSSIEIISKSSLSANRSRTCRPVVPDSPSINIFFLVAPRCDGWKTDDEDETTGWTNATTVFDVDDAMAIKSSADDLLIIFEFCASFSKDNNDGPMILNGWIRASIARSKTWTAGSITTIYGGNRVEVDFCRIPLGSFGGVSRDQRCLRHAFTSSYWLPR
jgi:hypothetical protein